MPYLICLLYLDLDANLPTARPLTGQQQFFIVSYLVISPNLVDYNLVGPLHTSSLPHLLTPLHASIKIMKTHPNVVVVETFKELYSIKSNLGKLSKIKTVKHMENSICWGGGSAHVRVLAFFVPEMLSTCPTMMTRGPSLLY